MIFARRILPSVLALLVMLAACGKDEPKSASVSSQRQATPDDLGRLVPADAVAFVRFSPVDQLQPKIRELIGCFSEQRAQEFDAAEIFSMAGIPPDRMDRSKVAGIALALVGEQKRPTPIFILPVKDPGKPIETAMPGEPVRSGDYVAVSLGTAPKVGTTTPALARDLPDGDVVVRLDARNLLAAFKPMIEPFLNAENIKAMSPELAAQPPQNLVMLDAMAEWARGFVDSADGFEGVLNFSQGKLDLALELTVLQGSPMDQPGVEGGIPLEELSKRIDAEGYPMVFLARADMSGLMDAFMPMYEAMLTEAPEEQRAKFRRYVEKSKEIARLMGPSFAVAASFSADGMEVVGAFGPKDPAAYVAAYRELISMASFPEMGFTMSIEDPIEVEGAKLDRYSLVFDWQKLMAAGGQPVAREQAAMAESLMASMFGDKGWVVAQGAVGDTAVIAAGRREGLLREVVRTAKNRSGSLPPAIREALTEDTGLLVYFDMRKLMAGMAGIMGTMTGKEMSLAAEPAVDLWMRAGAEGRARRFAVHFDLKGFSKVIEEMR